MVDGPPANFKKSEFVRDHSEIPWSLSHVSEIVCVAMSEPLDGLTHGSAGAVDNGGENYD